VIALTAALFTTPDKLAAAVELFACPANHAVNWKGSAASSLNVVPQSNSELEAVNWPVRAVAEVPAFVNVAVSFTSKQ